MDEFLKFPSVDPHGDPIPSADGEISKRKLFKLSTCKTEDQVSIARVIDQDANFLKLINRYGLIPGTKVTIEKNDDLADAITLNPKGQDRVTLGLTAASKILVE